MLRMSGLFTASAFLAAGAALLVTASPAHAVVVDAVGDFLPTYVGPQNGDLDVVRADALLTGPGQVQLIGEHAAAVGTTDGSAYVWGIDRGQGTDSLATLDPPVGAGVTFDAVAVLLADGSGFVLDLIAGTPPTFLDASAIGIAGSTITVTLDEALLPSAGFSFADYRYNLWPRFAPGGVDPGDNTQISDFAPDASTFAARVPEPVALLLGGAALALGATRARRAATRLRSRALGEA